MKKLSIVTPCLNAEKYIERAIQSVLDQDYENVEHIVMDGGSTDGTVEILKRYPQLIWVSEKDRGQSDALNKGLRRATGDVIGWLNADDYYAENCFGQVMRLFETEPIDALYGQNYFVDERGNITGLKRPNDYRLFVACFYCFIPSTAFFFSSKLLDGRDFVDAGFDLLMDKELYARLGREGCRFQYIRKPLAYFMWHGDNKSAVSPRVREASKRESVEILNRYFFNMRRWPYWLQTAFYKMGFYCATLRRKMLM